jgi:hypothetical protein
VLPWRAPAFTIGGLAPRPVERVAGVRLELVHDSLGRSLGLDDNVHMVGPYVRRQGAPAAVLAVPKDCLQYDFPAGLVEQIGILEHGSTFCQEPLRIRLHHTTADEIVFAVHRSHFVAMQACAVAGECNEISQRPLPCGRGSGVAYYLRSASDKPQSIV